MHFIYGLIVGAIAVAVVAIVWHKVTIADYQKAVATAGLYLAKVEGKITAIRKGLQ